MSFTAIHSVDEWAARFGAESRAILAIGNFDGVHCGHQAILTRVAESAHDRKCISVALTFSPHPLRVIRPEAAPPLIETLPQRLERMRQLELDAAFVMTFDRAVAAMPPQEFIERILVNTLRARTVFVGENFRFGHRQTGDVPLLKQLGRSCDFSVECIAPVTVRGIIVSSSEIRAAVSAGNMAQAARLLGRPFSLAGEIRTGTGTGRRFVFPTLNLATEQELLPARGVYATEATVRGRRYRAATNVGIRPTFDGTRLSIESHLLDFSEEITSGPLEVGFSYRLRDEQKFSGADALRAQIQKDIARARSFFARLDAARQLTKN